MSDNSNKENIDKKKEDKNKKMMGKVNNALLNAAGNNVDNTLLCTTSTLSRISSEES